MRFPPVRLPLSPIYIQRIHNLCSVTSSATKRILENTKPKTKRAAPFVGRRARSLWIKHGRSLLSSISSTVSSFHQSGAVRPQSLQYPLWGSALAHGGLPPFIPSISRPEASPGGSNLVEVPRAIFTRPILPPIEFYAAFLHYKSMVFHATSLLVWLYP